MKKYLFQQGVQLLIVCLGISVITFSLLHLTADPVLLLLPYDAGKEEMERFRKAMGFDQPIYVQYYRFLKGAVKGDFGNSLFIKKPSFALVMERMPATIEARRRQGSITTAGNTHARRAGVEGAWAYRSPAKVSRHLPLRLEKQPKRIQDIRWKAQVRLCKRYRRLIARGKHANVVTVAMARELAGFLWAIAHQVPVTPSGEDRSRLNDDLRRFVNVHRSMVYGYLGTEGETWTQNDAGTYALMRKAPQVGGGVLSQGKPTICVWGVLSSAALAPAGA